MKQLKLKTVVVGIALIAKGALSPLSALAEENSYLSQGFPAERLNNPLQQAQVLSITLKQDIVVDKESWLPTLEGIQMPTSSGGGQMVNQSIFDQATGQYKNFTCIFDMGSSGKERVLKKGQTVVFALNGHQVGLLKDRGIYSKSYAFSSGSGTSFWGSRPEDPSASISCQLEASDKKSVLTTADLAQTFRDYFDIKARVMTQRPERHLEITESPNAVQKLMDKILGRERLTTYPEGESPVYYPNRLKKQVDGSGTGVQLNPQSEQVSRDPDTQGVALAN